MSRAAYRRRAQQAAQELGLEQALAGRRLPLFPEARRLVPVGLGTDGRDKLLAPAAAAAWLAMRDAAARRGVPLLLVSAFRSFDFQRALVAAKLQRGMDAAEVLRINAPPGYSEHHSGRAVDIGSADTGPLEEAFETTAAYRWLRRHAARYRFGLSYPRGNAQGFAYEPWHWCYR